MRFARGGWPSFCSASTKEATIAGKDQKKLPPETPDLIRKHGIVQAGRMVGMTAPGLRYRAEREGWPLAKERAAQKISPAPEEVSEVEMLRARVKELEKAVKRDRKEHVYDERVTAAVEANLQRVKPKFKAPPLKNARKGSKTGHEFVLLLSDLHAGEQVSLEETGGINSYNWDIMLKRLGKLRESIASYQANRPYTIDRLRIFALGDQLSGNIHAELEATNEIPLAEATVQLGADTAEYVESFTEIFPEVTFDGVVGNHPRSHKKPWAKQGFDNADWTSYHIAAQSLRKHERVTFDIPKSSQHQVTIAGRWNGVLFHGDGIRSTMPGVPWGGVTRRVNALAPSYLAIGTQVHYWFLGHFHQANWVQTNAGWIAMNGSVKGPDEYSMKAFGGGAPAQQVLLTFHPEHGATDFSVIDL